MRSILNLGLKRDCCGQEGGGGVSGIGLLEGVRRYRGFGVLLASRRGVLNRYDGEGVEGGRRGSLQTFCLRRNCFCK